MVDFNKEYNQEYLEEKYVFYLELVIQRNLLLLLKVADVSIDKFASSLGLRAQTIRNLSAYDTFISRTQFISIMAIFEMERQNGINKEAIDTLLNAFLDVEFYKKYSSKIINFSKETIFKRNRKLSKKNTEFASGIFAAIGAFGVGAVAGALATPLLPIKLAVGATVTASAAVRKISREISKEKAAREIADELYKDIKKIENTKRKDPFSWMISLYNVKDSLQNNKYYCNFKNTLKELNTPEEKGALFDEYIDSLLKDLCSEENGTS